MNPVDPGWIARLEGAVAGRVERNASLDGFSTFRIGGPATALLEPRSAEDVVRALEIAGESGVPWLAIGLGSNVLFLDSGFSGLVIRPGKEMAALEQSPDRPERWSVGAGLPTPLLARRTARVGRTGVHRLVGVPGAVGGGVMMNAGAHGQEYSRVVKSVTLVREDGTVEDRGAEEIDWVYRNSRLERVVVLGCAVELPEADPAEVTAELANCLKRRKSGTPFDQPCCGSVFKNPPAAPRNADGTPMTAGQLIEAAGLKGKRVGDAEVSRKHANYIVNVDRASSADVIDLIDLIRGQVRTRFAIELELEVKVIAGQEKR